VGFEVVSATPMQRARMALTLSLLLMIVSLELLQRGIIHARTGGTIQDRAYASIELAGLLLLAGSSLVVVAVAISGSRKLGLAGAAATGAICLGIAAVFWRVSVSSMEGGITLRSWTLALSIPADVWAAAGVILLLVSGIRLLLGRPRGQNQ
jgi:hypothetical protein